MCFAEVGRTKTRWNPEAAVGIRPRASLPRETAWAMASLPRGCYETGKRAAHTRYEQESRPAAAVGTRHGVGIRAGAKLLSKAARRRLRRSARHARIRLHGGFALQGQTSSWRSVFGFTHVSVTDWSNSSTVLPMTSFSSSKTVRTGRFCCPVDIQRLTDRIWV